MFIAMNNFKIASGKGEEFERIWRERESHLGGVPGFLQFTLLRSDAEGEYISHSTWESRDAFTAWTQSEAFAAGHRQGSLMGVLQGPPEIKLYEGLIVETPAGRTVPAA
ncbi:MAG: antibiotic biosynthesis monooxygenase [Chloroflexi bacterium]|nr:antibiotic biosynthesis monooxygenase [Chloroflexota bacterium]MCI0850210.1 antibiotic biosynthesis monooxygenase [Chloroflexota bacterium]